MAFTLAQLDALEAGLAAGATSVSYEGKSVTYRSIDEMLRLRAIIRRALGLGGVSSRVVVAHDRGTGGGTGTIAGRLDDDF
jgi:hypothetical protein